MAERLRSRGNHVRARPGMRRGVRSQITRRSARVYASAVMGLCIAGSEIVSGLRPVCWRSGSSLIVRRSPIVDRIASRELHAPPGSGTSCAASSRGRCCRAGRCWSGSSPRTRSRCTRMHDCSRRSTWSKRMHPAKEPPTTHAPAVLPPRSCVL